MVSVIIGCLMLTVFLGIGPSEASAWMLRGFVINGTTMSNWAGVTVRAHTASGVETETITNETGDYELDVPNGTYTVEFVPPSGASPYYCNVWWESQTSSGSASAVPIADSDWFLGGQIMHERSGFAGTVRDYDDSTPLPGVTVSVFTTAGAEVTRTVTDANGEYLIRPLENSEYLLRFDPAPYNQAHPNDPNYHAESYESPLLVIWGPTPSYVSPWLTKLWAGGTVLDASDPPQALSGATVRFWRGSEVVTSTTASGSGTYLAIVPAGDYKVDVDPLNFNLNNDRLYAGLWWPSAETSAAATTVTVNATTTPTCNFTLHERAIRGTIGDADNYSWLQGVVVCLRDHTGSTVATTATDGLGRYSFSDLNEGTYGLWFEFSHATFPLGRTYEDRWYSANPSSEPSTPILIEGDVLHSLVSYAMPQSRLYGTLTHEASAVAGVEVRVYTSASISALVATAVSDADGEFSVIVDGDVSYGIYYDPSLRNQLSGSDVSGGWRWSSGLIDYPWDTEFVAAGGSKDVSMELPDSYAITGRVVNAAGESVPLCQVFAYPVAAEGYAFEEWDSVNTWSLEDGRYRINLPSTWDPMTVGYRLNFLPPSGTLIPEWYDDSISQQGATLVVPSPGSDASADATLVAYSTVTGVIRNEQSESMAGVGITFVGLDGQPNSSAVSEEGGVWQVSALVGGDYRIVFNASPYDEWFSTFYDTSYYDGEPSASTADTYTVPTQTDVTGLEINLVQQLGSMTGTVTDEFGTPLQGIAVTAHRIIIPGDEEWTEIEASTVTTESGGFAFEDIRRGEYRVEFGAGSGHAGEWYSNQRTPAGSTVVTVTAFGVASGINASLERPAVLTGTVRNSVTDELITWLPIIVMGQNGDGWIPIGYPTVSEAGTFTASLSYEGPTKIFFGSDVSEPTVGSWNTKWYVDSSSVESATPVNVSLGATVSIDATCGPTGSISGNITWPNLGLAEEIEQSRVVAAVAYRLEAGQWVVRGSDTCSTWSTQSAEYSIGGLPKGTYIVQFTDSISSMTARTFHGGLNRAEATRVYVGDGDHRTGIDGAIVRCGYVDGTLTDNNGEPILTELTCAEASLYLKEGSGWRYITSQYVLDYSAQFSFGGLTPGEYTLLSRAPSHYTEVYHDLRAIGFHDWTDPMEYAPPVWARTFTVVSSEHTQISVRLQPTSPSDLVAPVTSPSVASGWYTSPMKVTFDVMDTDSGAYITYAGLDGGQMVEGSTLPTITKEGLTVLRYRSTDAAGNREATKTAEIRIDTDPPVTAHDGKPAYLDQAIVRFYPTDAVSGPEFTRYSIDGSLPTIGSAAITSVPGTHTIAFWSADKAGNAEEPQEFTFVVGVDDRPPVTLIGVERWPGRAVVSFEIADDNATGAVTNWLLDSVPGTGTPVVIETAGTHTLQYWSVDGVGNTEAPRSVTIELVRDTTAPVTTAEAPTGWIQSAEITFTASDSGSGVLATYYSDDGLTPRFPYFEPLAITREGTTTIRYRSVDREGNAEAVRSLLVRVDATAPLTSHAVTRRTGEATVTLTALDALSGVSGTRYSVSGSAAASGTVIVLSDPGTHTVEYRSTDVAGNVESSRTIEVVVDEATHLATSVSRTKVVYPGTVVFSSAVSAGLGAGISGLDVALQFSANRLVWTTVATARSVSGTATLTARPSVTGYYRTVFAGTPRYAAAAPTAPVLVTVVPYLRTMYAPASVYMSRTFSVYVLMSPKHVNGTSNVLFRFYRYESGRWVLRKTVRGRNYTYNSTTTKVVGYASLPYRGSWKVIAYHPADAHAAAYSSERRITVR